MVKRALLIGINYYGSKLELSGCINDVDNMQSYLVQEQGFVETDIVRLTDAPESDKRHQPTRSNILRWVDWLVQNLKAGDSVFFQYSGHGSQVRDTSGDESDGRDETLVPSDYLKNGQIIDDELRSRLAERIPQGASLCAVIDACHSGSGLDLRWNFEDQSRYIGKGRPARYEAKLWNTSTLTRQDRQYRETQGNVLCISGCRDNQTSADAWEDGAATGAMTYALLKALKRAKADGKQELSLQRLLKDMSNILRVKRYRQVPQMSAGRKVALDSKVWTLI
jgi:hypothetical protein